jgi:xylan 1,4-beta-xylosidase
MKQWNFEVWNEPNLHNFWTGTQRNYFKLYRYTAEAIKSVDSSLTVGGPATAKNEWIEEFRDFCERSKVPLDFISTHHYPTDAFGQPGDDTETQLSKSRRAALRDQALDARRNAGDVPLYYTEWNSSSNPFDPLHDQPYAAAFVVKSVMDVAGVVDAYSFWTFSDIFEENYFSSTPFHGGFGLLNVHGVAKPTYRAFQLLHRLGNTQRLVDGLHETVNVWVIGNDDKLIVLMINHALPGHTIETERVSMRLLNATEPRAAWIERVDEDHANPRQVWREMGAPDYLSNEEITRLSAASEVVRKQQRFRYKDASISFEINLTPHSVTSIEFELAAPLAR